MWSIEALRRTAVHSLTRLSSLSSSPLPSDARNWNVGVRPIGDTVSKDFGPLPVIPVHKRAHTKKLSRFDVVHCRHLQAAPPTDSSLPSGSLSQAAASHQCALMDFPDQQPVRWSHMLHRDCRIWRSLVAAPSEDACDLRTDWRSARGTVSFKLRVGAAISATESAQPTVTLPTASPHGPYPFAARRPKGRTAPAAGASSRQTYQRPSTGGSPFPD